MEKDAQLKRIAEDFLERLLLPKIRPKRPYILGVIGQIGSGKTMVSRLLAKQLSGSVVVSANSARFLLLENNLPWGDNVRTVVKLVGQRLVTDGYGVIFDGSVAEEKDRANIKEAAYGIPVWYIRILLDVDMAKARERKKYDDRRWISSFEDFRVNTIEAMLKNIDDRVIVHEELKSSDVPGLIAEIDNSGSLGDLQHKVRATAEKIKSAL